ncbi:MAG: PspC domain-containing protein [Rubrivivax sp.]|nr:PspC domain-containing protein [Rubrivivax sp.]
MSLADEFTRLQALRDSGTLTEDEFQRAKARVLDGGVNVSPAEINKLRRSVSDRWIGGVCGGIAALTGIESWIWRLLLTVLAVFGGTGILIYILLWIFVPSD